jgi:hypothetical protein
LDSVRFLRGRSTSSREDSTENQKNGAWKYHQVQAVGGSVRWCTLRAPGRAPTLQVRTSIP